MYMECYMCSLFIIERIKIFCKQINIIYILAANSMYYKYSEKKKVYFFTRSF